MPTTNEKVRSAYEDHHIVRLLDSDPAAANLSGGEIWYRTDTNEWRAYDGTSFVTINTTADA